MAVREYTSILLGAVDLGLERVDCLGLSRLCIIQSASDHRNDQQQPSQDQREKHCNCTRNAEEQADVRSVIRLHGVGRGRKWASHGNAPE